MLRSLPWLVLATLIAGPAAAQPAPNPDVVAPVKKGTDGLQVLELHQQPCVFREAEADPLPFKAERPEDCARINRVSLEIRRKGFKRLRVKAGKYKLRIFNVSVPWPVGFALKGAHDPSLPKVTGEGIAQGSGKEFLVDLVPGLYVYFCPVSHTAEYALLVER